MKTTYRLISLILVIALFSFAAPLRADAAPAAVWSFSAFGANVDLKTNGFSGNANTGSVQVWSTGGKGKLQPNSTDGLAFYYTGVDPRSTNFKLSATATVDSWTYSNGQEGFGIMACDAVGDNGSPEIFWNNSYMATVTKVQYKGTSGSTIQMQLGIGAQAKTGVTPENISSSRELIDASLFSSVMTPLEDSCTALSAGKYNIVGNYTNETAPEGTVAEPLTSFRLSVEKNNTGYAVSYTDPSGKTVKQQYYDADALSRLDEENVYIGFYASRNATVTFSDISFTTSDSSSTDWSFSAFGDGVSLKNNGSSTDAETGDVRVWSTGGKGKLQPKKTDGLAFYYTSVDPDSSNFKLTATACVNSWTYSNGQEGFGLMACDAVGANGSTASFWNNSYMASVTKVQYKGNAGTVEMQLGVGAQEKKGVTPDNIAVIAGGDTSQFSSSMTPLERSCADQPAGIYNIVGNYTNDPAPAGTVDEPLTTFTLSIEKTDQGYTVSYTDAEGSTVSESYSDPDALSCLDSENVYVGLFAARNADVTFKDICFTVTGKEQPLTEVPLSCSVESSAYANSEDYTLMFYANADGELVIRDSSSALLFEGRAEANTRLDVPLALVPGSNVFKLTFTPDEGFIPGEHEVLSSYAPVRLTHSVSFNVNDTDVIYVSPSGRASAAGTRTAPQDLRGALRRAVPGQKIVMLEGTYDLSSRLNIDRGLNGTEDAEIWLMADPESDARPVIDFGGSSAGFLLDASYWHLYGFDVTGTKSGECGILVSGSHNTLELLETYENGNSGIQISRRKVIDGRGDWPSYNTVLACTSMFNADHGYEDADGFAAKLTCGEGNVFDRCIAAYNADDGYDLYAKAETGSIGKVTIRNSVAYKNGWLIGDDGSELPAGNGNGFKMGGESLEGGHTIINSIAFANRNKGIDSNSCPDICIENCTSYNNGSANIALYTGLPKDTAYSVSGALSYRYGADGGSAEDMLEPRGSQSVNDLRDISNYYYRSGSSANSAGTAVSPEWFVSLDTGRAIAEISRLDDGSIDLHGYLELTENAPADTGARLAVQHVHDWEGPEWTWNGTDSASATFTCAKDPAHTVTLEAEIAEEADGSRTARVSFEGEEYTDSLPAEETLLLGDVDLSGKVDAADLTNLARHVARISEITDPQALKNADVTFDREVKADDLTKLARFIARIIGTLEE